MKTRNDARRGASPARPRDFRAGGRLALACLGCLLLFAPVPAAQAQSFDRLVASDARPGDLFGSFDGVLAVSGNRILVGKPLDDDACPPGPEKPFCNSGAAYVFERQGGVWMEVAKLTAGRPTGRDWFGASVAIDGDRALIGASFQDDAGTDAGTVYVFERIGGQWQEVDRLFASDSDPSDLFGDRRVILRGDLALVAAPQDSEANILAGAIYIFEFNGLNWNEIDKLTASDAGVADFLGHAMDLDGDRLIAGAPTAEKDNISIAGEAYIFERNRGVWQEWARFQPADLDTTDALGFGVGIHGDWAMAGAPNEDPPDCMFDPGRPIFCDEGKVYVFRRQANGNWEQVDILIPAGLDQLDRFGNEIALDATHAFISAGGDDDACPPGAPDPFGIGCNTGAVYVYELQNNQWQLVDKLIPNGLQDLALFGASLALSERWFLAGAPGGSILDSGSDNRGAVYVLKRKNEPPVAQDDAAATGTGAAVEIFVLDNDSDPDADHLTLRIAAQPANGSVEFSIEGNSIVYTPNGGFSGTDTFTYEIDDGDGGSDQATVAVSVGSPPSPPQITSPADGARVVVMGDPATAFAVEWTASTDPDGDALTYIWQLAATSDFAPVLFAQETGAATRFETDFGTVGALLRDAGVGVGMSVTLFHRATASDGGFTTPGAALRVTLERGAITATEDEDEVPSVYALSQNYPNPFNPQTTIPFALPEAAQVRLAVFDVLGREVAVLVEGRLPAGRHAAVFAADGLPGGMYVYRLAAGARTLTRTMLLIQ